MGLISKSIYRIGWRYLIRHPWQTIMMVVGITLGVSVAVSIDLANASAARAFDLSTEAITGRATHQISAEPKGLDESLYARLVRANIVDIASPILTEYVSSPQLGNRAMQLLGVDPFTEAPFRSYIGSEKGIPSSDLTTFFTKPGAILLSAGSAERYGLTPCSSLIPSDLSNCQIILEISGKQEHAYFIGLIDSDPTSFDNLERRSLDNLIITDISTAQELTGKIGYIDRIDLILPAACNSGSFLTDSPGPVCPEIKKLLNFLPVDVKLSPIEARQGSVEQMTAAFRLNLTALSLLALVVGMFLIYNTMTFSVVRRRPLFGTLRCLGVTQREIFLLVISEALIIGAIGSILGIILGVLMGQGAVRMVTQTINDLYFALTVEGVQVPASSLIKGILMGVCATIFSAAPPAWEAASVSPSSALRRSGLEMKAKQAVGYAALVGAVLISLSGILLFIPTNNLVISFLATFLIIVGFALLAPIATKGFMLLLPDVLETIWGVLGRMAPRDVVKSLSRTSVAVAALTITVSVTIGVSLMISSFRYTVITWLDQTLQGDVYISAPTPGATQPTTNIDPVILGKIYSWPGVKRVDVLRATTVDSPSGLVHVAATDNPDIAMERVFLSSTANPELITKRMENGAVLVSEPLANRLNLPKEDAEIRLFASNREIVLPVAGIYYDYASSQGTVLMTLDTYRSYWQDLAITAVALRLQESVSPGEISNMMEEDFAPIQRLLVRPNQTLREEVLVVFDRTFAITGALQLLAVLVAFIGILSALLSWQLDKQREIGILRAIGLTTHQMWRLVMIESGLLGGMAGLLALPTGYTLALILIYIINKRSFGWTLQMHLEAEPFIQAIILSVLAALIASIYPALKISHSVTVEALRSE